MASKHQSHGSEKNKCVSVEMLASGVKNINIKVSASVLFRSCRYWTCRKAKQFVREKKNA